MFAIRERLEEMLDNMRKPEQILLFDIAKRLAPDYVAAVKEARSEDAWGETVSH